MFGRPIQRDGRIVRGAKDSPRPGRRHLSTVQSGAATFGTHQRLPRLARPDAVHARHARQLHHGREAARDAGAHSRRHGRACRSSAAADLSGGQQQRAAIARTLVQGAELLIADEPIASLDPASARRVMDILAELNRRDGITDPDVAAPGRVRPELLHAHDRVEGRRRSSTTGRPTRSRRNSSAASTVPRAANFSCPGSITAAVPLALRRERRARRVARCAHVSIAFSSVSQLDRLSARLNAR